MSRKANKLMYVSSELCTLDIANAQDQLSSFFTELLIYAELQSANSSNVIGKLKVSMLYPTVRQNDLNKYMI